MLKTRFRVYFSSSNTEIISGRDKLNEIMNSENSGAIAFERAKIHTCSICGKKDDWKPGWSVGSKPSEKLVYCSTECRPDDLVFWHNKFNEPLSKEAMQKRSECLIAVSAEKKSPTGIRKVPMRPYCGRGSCRWCTKPIIAHKGKYKGEPDPNRSWHKQCYEEYCLYTDRTAQYEHIVYRDGNVCTDCGHPGKWVSSGQPLVNWQSEDIKKAYENKFGYPYGGKHLEGRYLYWTHNIISPSTSVLEVDHDTPLWKIKDLPDDERKQYFGPDNLKLRCKQCHKKKTSREAGERAIKNREEN